MARFDVMHTSRGKLVIDCQADLLDDLNTRFVVPLLPIDEAPPPNLRLNPRFSINGESLIMVTQFAAAIRVAELKSKVASLADDHIRIINAIDVLTGSG